MGVVLSHQKLRGGFEAIFGDKRTRSRYLKICRKAKIARKVHYMTRKYYANRAHKAEREEEDTGGETMQYIRRYSGF